MTSSHNFLSMIFGIFGKFGIEICERNKKSSMFFSSKKKKWSNKSKKFWSKKKSIEKKVDRKKKSSNKISITFFFRPKNIFDHFFFRSIFFSTKNVSIFFDEHCFGQKIPTMFFDHLFRSEISLRFQKSYLEQRAMILNGRKNTNTKIFLKTSRSDAKPSKILGIYQLRLARSLYILLVARKVI